MQKYRLILQAEVHPVGDDRQHRGEIQSFVGNTPKEAEKLLKEYVYSLHEGGDVVVEAKTEGFYFNDS